jgi:hypothetical protein
MKQVMFFSPLSNIEHPASLRFPGQAMRYYLHQFVDLPVSRFGGIRAGKAELRY